jgi:hypothetical protein
MTHPLRQVLLGQVLLEAPWAGLAGGPEVEGAGAGRLKWAKLPGLVPEVTEGLVESGIAQDGDCVTKAAGKGMRGGGGRGRKGQGARGRKWKCEAV